MSDDPASKDVIKSIERLTRERDASEAQRNVTRGKQ